MRRDPDCYMCEARATSREHAPPLCLFPEQQEIGRDLRCNLVTVPSCDLHNSRKQTDDEFFRAVILMFAAGNSTVAQLQFLGKLLRAAKRKPEAHSSFFVDYGKIADGSGNALQIDVGRFEKCIDHLARALFFDAFKAKWSLSFVVASPNLHVSVAGGIAVPRDRIRAIDATRDFLIQENVKGENPDVFMYRLRFDQSSETYAFAAIFYNFFEVFAVSSPALTGAMDSPVGVSKANPNDSLDGGVSAALSTLSHTGAIIGERYR